MAILDDKKKKGVYSGKVVKFPVKLQMAVEDWGIHTKDMRRARKKMLEHYAAGWYTNKQNFAQPMNLIDRGVGIIAPFLVTNNPKVMVDAKRNMEALKPFARTMELALEHLFSEIKLAQRTLRPAVISSLFCMGITKTGIAREVEIEIGGKWFDSYTPYCDNVDFEDYVGDATARRREEMCIEGNRYLLDEEFVKTSGYFKAYDKLQPDTPLYNDQTRAETISKGTGHGWQLKEIRPKVELIDLYIPKENTIVTIAPMGQGDRILRTVEYDGPEGGPYDLLGYRFFPDTVIPIPPVWTWLDLNSVINRLVSKMKQQAEREKTIGVYSLGAQQDAINIKESIDGDMVGVKNTEDIKEVSFGGINPQAFPFVQYLEQQYSIGSGNLYTLGGRKTGADTLGQEQMLQANASKQLEDMVEQVHEFTKSVTKKLAWYLWTDPLIQIPLIKRVGELELQVTYSKDEQEGDFLDYQFDIEPYSMQKMSPEMRYQRLIQLISAVVLPTAQMAAAQGSNLNAIELVKEAGRYMDIRNIDVWYNTGMPQDVQTNPYQPSEGAPKGASQQKGGQPDGRTTTSDSEGSNLNNMIQQQNRDGGKSSVDYAKQ